MTKFEVGKTYFCRSIGDYDCVYRFKVERRTAQTIWVSGDRTGPFRVKEWDGVEVVKPLGRYSMAPTLMADKVAS